MPKKEFLEKLRQRAATQKIAEHLGIVLEEVSPGYAKATMVCREDMSNILGMVHGSALFALMDEAFQAAVNSHGLVAVALNMSLTFHQAPRFGERLTATAREIHTGRRLATCFIEATDASGALVASCQALAYRKAQPHEF
jgi:acyl-CoA thioesterase|uniref:PaaI family thioesterase n=1 Tax=Desulfobacca acetoxidans TaxID=60893 RepID=A0A7C3SIB9_9BACT